MKRARPTTWKGLFIYSALLVLAVITVGMIVDQLVLPSVANATRTLTIPDVEGKSLNDAIIMLEARGLVVMPPHEQFSSTVAAGTVLNQMPYAGATVKSGRRVYLTVSKGAEVTTMPDLRGRSVREARLTLLRIGVQLGNVMYEFHDSVPPECIIAQSLPPGSNVSSDAMPNVTVSQGPMAVSVPELIGIQLTEARRLIVSRGLEVGQITRIRSTVFEPNTVLDSDPPALSSIQPTRKINLIVAD